MTSKPDDDEVYHQYPLDATPEVDVYYGERNLWTVHVALHMRHPSGEGLQVKHPFDTLSFKTKREAVLAVKHVAEMTEVRPYAGEHLEIAIMPPANDYLRPLGAGPFDPPDRSRRARF